MKSFWFKFVVICLIFLNIFLLFGCSKESKNDSKNKIDKENSIKPKEFVSNYYNSEVNRDEIYLSKFYNNPNQSNTKEMKKKFKDFGITKMELINVYNIKSYDRLKVMVSAFNVYFQNIKKPRPDVEIIVLIYKNNSWYFLNDASVTTDKEYEWLQNEKKNQEEFIVKNRTIQDILKNNTEFDNENRDYMKMCEQRFQSDVK
ncbi:MULTISPECIES: hypothetical protein [Clostridium]|uniref:hypothetical protein n=1 Tax=Clostridium TaxID=1485 RepID=UPI0008261E6B|nr:MULTISPECIES: hypothetical protein [Clostridium]PJI07859.1 hypothetical protein CUB90_08270 [Clostridium sp. CT7]